MEKLVNFLRYNKASLAGMIIGLIAGYTYWSYIACFRGTFPMSAECWFNCLLGAIAGGFLVSLVEEYIVQKS